MVFRKSMLLIKANKSQIINSEKIQCPNKLKINLFTKNKIKNSQTTQKQPVNTTDQTLYSASTYLTPQTLH